MSKLDKKYENAIRYYLDKVVIADSSTGTSVRTVEANVAKTFARHIKTYADKNFTFSCPMFAWWDLTSACNFRCVHCLYNDSEYSCRDDLTTEELMVVANELCNELGVVEVILSGGEIFLREDLPQIIKILKDNNVGVKLLTNASLINDRHIDFLADTLSPYCDSMQISLDGATNETYFKIRQSSDFDKVTSNIKKLVDKNINVGIAGVVNKINYDEFPLIYEYCDKLNADTFYASKMMCFNESHRKLEVTPKELMLLSEKLLLLEEKLKTRLQIGFFSNMELVNNPDILQILEEEGYQQEFFKKRKTILDRGCNYHDRISIKSNGDVYMCSYASCIQNASFGNVRDNSLSEIWEKRFNNDFYQCRDINKMKCKTCKYNVFCASGCMVKAYKNFGSINAPEIDCVFYK